MVKKKQSVQFQTLTPPTEFHFRGVRKRKWGKWVSEIRLPHSRDRIWLGSYDTPHKAARAFDAALFCLRGGSAKFNFPDNPPRILTPLSLSSAEIQAIAASFAHSEPSKSDSDLSVHQSPPPSPSPSPSPVFEETVQLESGGGSEHDSLFEVPFTGLGPANYESDGSIFPDFDKFFDDLVEAPVPYLDYEEENWDGIIIDDSFLWSF